MPAGAPRDAEKAPSIDPSLASRIAAFAGAGADRQGFVAPAPVSTAVIKQMTDAVGDRNPVYTDEALSLIHISEPTRPY